MGMAEILRILWTDACTVTVREPVTDPETHLTDFQEREILTDEPCRVSFQSVAAAGEGSTAAVTQTVKLFLQPDVEIPPGSRITVVRDGNQLLYTRSGEPARYPGHQEIQLELWQKWA